MTSVIKPVYLWSSSCVNETTPLQRRHLIVSSSANISTWWRLISASALLQTAGKYLENTLFYLIRHLLKIKITNKCPPPRNVSPFLSLHLQRLKVIFQCLKQTFIKYFFTWVSKFYTKTSWFAEYINLNVFLTWPWRWREPFLLEG